MQKHIQNTLHIQETIVLSKQLCPLRHCYIVPLRWMMVLDDCLKGHTASSAQPFLQPLDLGSKGRTRSPDGVMYQLLVGSVIYTYVQNV